MQDYQLIVRTLGPVSNLESGVQNYSEFRSYLQENYINQGYNILAITLLGNVADHGPHTFSFAYHLVKEIEPTPTKVKTDK